MIFDALWELFSYLWRLLLAVPTVLFTIFTPAPLRRKYYKYCRERNYKNSGVNSTTAGERSSPGR